MRLVGIAMIATAAASARADTPTPIVVPPEVIEVHGKPPPIVAARPAFDVRRVPPYSDRAMLGDYWASAWLLLDVAATGAVTRIKLLARPGHDLDTIAIDYALGLRFEPARAGTTPISSYVVWRLEWPSYFWMIDRFGSAVRVNPAKLPPCGDDGPIDFDARRPVRRLCGRYERAALDREPWLTAAQKRR